MLVSSVNDSVYWIPTYSLSTPLDPYLTYGNYSITGTSGVYLRYWNDLDVTTLWDSSIYCSQYFTKIDNFCAKNNTAYGYDRLSI